MGHQKKRALEIGQHLLDGLARRYVQMVRRLVQDQKVRVLVEHLRQLKTVSLPSREAADALLVVVRSEHVTSQ